MSNRKTRAMRDEITKLRAENEVLRAASAVVAKDNDNLHIQVDGLAIASKRVAEECIAMCEQLAGMRAAIAWLKTNVEFVEWNEGEISSHLAIFDEPAEQDEYGKKELEADFEDDDEEHRS